MRGAVGLVSCSICFVACAQTPDSASTDARLSEAECEALYEALLDDHQREVEAWGARVEAARGTAQFEILREQGPEITRRFLPRFQELADQGCGRAKYEVLDLLGHMEPLDESQVGYALGFLDDLVHEHTDASWIFDLGDDDIIRYFLLGSERDRAIELLAEFVELTSDEDARREVLFELGYGLILVPGEPADRDVALRMLDRVVETWPETGRAETARGLLRNERELQVGAVMPALEGRDVDGRETRLQDYRGRVVVVDFFGFWCAPCKEGIPVLKELVAHYPAESFTVLGVDAYDDEATFRRGRDRFGVSWPCIFDGTDGPLSRRLGISVFPAVFVLDEQRVIRARNPSEDELERIVARLVRGE